MTTIQEHGREWDVRTPRGDVAWYVRRLHVSVTNEDLAIDIRTRCNCPGFTPEIIAETVDYAIICHAINRRLYARVYTGNLT